MRLLTRLQRPLLNFTGLAAGSLLLGAGVSRPEAGSAACLRVLQAAERLAGSALSSSAPGSGDECALVADIAETASVHDLIEDLGLNLATCVNEESTTPEKFDACLQGAFDEFSKGLGDVELQHAARLELCALLGGGIYDPDLDEDDFEDEVEHAFLPFATGATWVYETGDGREENVVTVLDKTQEIDDVESIVVHDVVMVDGVLEEDTLDWFAQHEDGTVWYMGELSQSLEDGELVSLDGSWQAGEEGALPGIVMLAHPAVGQTYRQELRLTEAEDAATVLSLSATAVVPAGTFTDCLKTADFSPLEPGAVEYKYYARGVGLVLEENPGSGERNELLSFTPGN
jgi:hypothetical protein